jgi:hypothetical protein
MHNQAVALRTRHKVEQPKRILRRGFWESVPVRIAVVTALVATFFTVALVGDREPEPWWVKTGEFAQQLSAQLVGHPLSRADNTIQTFHTPGS